MLPSVLAQETEYAIDLLYESITTESKTIQFATEAEYLAWKAKNVRQS